MIKSALSICGNHMCRHAALPCRLISVLVFLLTCSLNPSSLKIISFTSPASMHFYTVRCVSDLDIFSECEAQIILCEQTTREVKSRQIQCGKQHLSRVMRKPTFRIYTKIKTQISFAVTAKLISAFVFAIRIIQSLYFLNPKFQASSHLL